MKIYQPHSTNIYTHTQGRKEKSNLEMEEKRGERCEGGIILSHSWSKRPLRSCGLKELIGEVQEIICLKKEVQSKGHFKDYTKMGNVGLLLPFTLQCCRVSVFHLTCEIISKHELPWYHFPCSLHSFQDQTVLKALKYNIF